MAQHVQGAALIQLLAHPVQQRGLGRGAVALDQRLPRFRLAGLHPGGHVRRVQRAGAVVMRGIDFGVQPSVCRQAGADVVLEADFLVQVHGIACFTSPLKRRRA
jgi:hypothetical protein